MTSFLLALIRLVLLAAGLALLLGWLKNEQADLALTLPWTLYPVSGGLVLARSLTEWEGDKSGRNFLVGTARVAAFFAIVMIAQWGFHGSMTAIAIAFVSTLALGVYHQSA